MGNACYNKFYSLKGVDYVHAWPGQFAFMFGLTFIQTGAFMVLINVSISYSKTRRDQ